MSLSQTAFFSFFTWFQSFLSLNILEISLKILRLWFKCVWHLKKEKDEPE